MDEFLRARSDEQKNQRVAEIKEVTAELFKTHAYHEITLSTIGEHLGWSRANLYKYVSSKEEIFLQLAADARDAYYEELLKAFSKKKYYDKEEAAKKWAHVSNKTRDWAVYGSILVSIIEQNVTLERLKEFKKGYYDQLDVLTEQLAPKINIKAEDFALFFSTIHYHACGLSGFCETNPMIKQAIKELGIKRMKLNYKSEMQRFILMCLNEFQEH